MKPPRTIRPRATKARELRRDATPAEHHLWQALRKCELPGRLRRQHPIGNYIVDFAIPAANLVIEIDGETHAETAEADAARTAFLESKGYRVIRFWNAEVHDNVGGVVHRILEALEHRE